jgi:hypothetical protein
LSVGKWKIGALYVVLQFGLMRREKSEEKLVDVSYAKNAWLRRGFRKRPLLSCVRDVKHPSLKSGFEISIKLGREVNPRIDSVRNAPRKVTQSCRARDFMTDSV